MEIAYVPADMHAMIQQALDITAPGIQAKQHALTVPLEPERSQLNGDPMRLKQIVWN